MCSSDKIFKLCWKTALIKLPKVQVVHLAGCASLQNKDGAAAVAVIAAHGKLRKLELFAVPDATILNILQTSRELESLSACNFRWDAILVRLCVGACMGHLFSVFGTIHS